MSVNYYHELTKEILSPENNYNYKIVQKEDRIFNKLLVTISLEKLIKLSEKYNALNKDDCDLLLTYFNKEWTYFGSPSLIKEDDKTLYEMLKLANETNDFSTEVKISILNVRSKIYFYNNRQDFYKYLTLYENIIQNLNNSLSLHNLISHDKLFPMIFLREENMWIDQNWMIDYWSDKNDHSSGLNTEIFMFIQNYKSTKQSYLRAKKDIEDQFLKTLKNSYNRVIDLNLVVQDTITSINHIVK